jgi:hypothetical protein
LTVGSGVTLRGLAALLGSTSPNTFGDSVLVNQGTIVADNANGEVSVVPNMLLNQGALRAQNGGSMTVTASTFSSSGVIEATSPSRIFVQPQLHATGGSVGGSGPVRANGGAEISGTVRKTGSGALRVSGTLAIQPGATLDVISGAIILDYGGITPFDQIRDQIISGYAGGVWNGSGMASSAAAASAGFGLGCGGGSALLLVSRHLRW